MSRQDDSQRRFWEAVDRRTFLRWSAGAAAASLGVWISTAYADAAREEITLAEIQAAMARGELTARSLVAYYLGRIEALDRQGPALRAVIEVNPDALTIADTLDAERKTKGPRGPLHGVPVLLKDNIDTADRMMTTAGSFALVGDPPLQDATVAKRLRDAGAILLGKANLSEWANFRSDRSKNGWSARGGQARCPYVVGRDPLGSSTGSAVAVAANLCALSLGTETDGSIISPAATNGVVGLKPTVGLTSRAGVIPISHTQDSVGPMARTVTDLAILLGALTGVDPRDAATTASDGRSHPDYTKFLEANGLKGARIGLPFGPGGPIGQSAVQTMQAAGAEIVSSAPIPRLSESVAGEFEVLLYEFKAGLNAYLSTRRGVRIRTLAEAIKFNETHATEEELKRFGQAIFLQAQERGPLNDGEYLTALDRSHRLSRESLDAVMNDRKLDALVAFERKMVSPPARAGYPVITVPAGFDSDGMPGYILFAGRAFSEPTLLRLAYAFEQATKARRPPQYIGVSRP
jgi:amidase